MSTSRPKSNSITLREFINVCRKEEYGAELITLDTEVHGDFGSWHPVGLERSDGTVQLRAMLPHKVDLDEELDPYFIRSMCKHLRIPLSEFGIEFDPKTGAISFIADKE